ncbi:MAG: hypothetical protein PHW73_14135, partial [Atribacterota bacterium]|nr:hypothetical protein [Atribacterota bacterium]
MFLIIIIPSLIFLIFEKGVQAAPIQDNVNGTWTDDYSDTTGFSTLSDTTVSSGVLSLSGSPGSYPSSGTARTVTIIPLSVIRWGQIAFDVVTPPNTSFKIQVIDEYNYVFPDSKLSGNTAGFTSSPIDISSLLVTHVAFINDAKLARLRFLITLYSNDNTVTPTIDNFSLSWSVKSGPFNFSTIADTYWPISGGSVKRSEKLKTDLEFDYPVVRWVKDMGYLGISQITTGFNDELILKSQGTPITWTPVNVTTGRFIRINRNNGEEINSTDWDGATFSDIDLVVTEDHTLYYADIFTDIVVAYDLETWQLKWTYSFIGGHTFGSIIVDN